jgi:prenyltransferase beta subunit
MAAVPARAADTDNRGLFGSQDPTYDGVYRQAYALMGLAASGVRAPRVTIEWLLSQQCADGSFVAYRADLDVPCPAPDPAAYTGPDTNSTSLAALALLEHGETRAAERAIAWLTRIQLPGGGWGYVEGSPADSNSTALSLEALEAVPGTLPQQRAATRWLARQISPCTAPVGERYGMSYQPGALPDGISSSQGLLAFTDAFPVRESAQSKALPKVSCDDKGKPTNPALAVTRWIGSTINANAGSIPDPFTPGAADWNSTALGIIGMVASRTAGRATELALTSLEANAESYVNDGTGDRPAALGTLLLVTKATGSDASDFGGIDLTERLLDTIQD